jgi:hypothetical protein
MNQHTTFITSLQKIIIYDSTNIKLLKNQIKNIQKNNDNSFELKNNIYSLNQKYFELKNKIEFNLIIYSILKKQIKNETYLIRNLKNKIKNDMKTNNISKNIEYNFNGNIKYYKTAHDLFLLRKNNQKRHYWYFMLKNIKTSRKNFE